VLSTACRESDLRSCEDHADNSLLFPRQYLDYFGIDGQDAGGGVGTTTAIIFGIVCHLFSPTVRVADPVRQYAIGIAECFLAECCIDDIMQAVSLRLLLQGQSPILLAAKEEWYICLSLLYRALAYHHIQSIGGFIVLVGRSSGQSSERLP
jgi:hypothetical protein